MTKPLLIGEAPSATGDPDPAAALCGSAYCRFGLPLGWTLDEWQTQTDRLNLLPRFPGHAGKGSAFPMAEASALAATLLPSLVDRVVVLFGWRVAAAFGLRRGQYGTWTDLSGCRAVVLPHPSGVNRAWNDLAVRSKAVRIFEEEVLHA